MSAGDRPGLAENAFYAFVLTMTAGPLDRLIVEHAVAPAARAAAWALIYAGFALVILRRPRHSLRGLAAAAPLMLMPAYALLSVLWSVQPQQTATAAVQLGASVIFGSVMGARIGAARLVTLVVAVLGALAVADLFAVFASPIGLDDNGNAVGLFSHKNTNGEVMAKLCLAALAILFWGGPRVLALFALALALPMLALSGSRTAWVAAAAGTLALLLPCFRRLGAAARAVAVLGGVAVASVGGILWISSGIDVFAVFLEAADKDPTLTGRTVLWELAENAIRQAPIAGQGYDAYWQADITSNSAFVNSVVKENVQSFHNGFLEIAVELGWIGVALEVALLAGFVIPVRELVRNGDPTAAAFALGLLAEIAITNVSEVSVFVRHGFNLFLLAALWAQGRTAGGTRLPI